MTQRRHVRYDLYNDFYMVLGVDPAASNEDLQRAYRQRAKDVHPDRNPEKLAWANDQVRRLNEAYDVLKDPDLRAEYDRQRGRYHPHGGPGTGWQTQTGRARSSAARSSAGRTEPEPAFWEYANPPRPPSGRPRPWARYQSRAGRSPSWWPSGGVRNHYFAAFRTLLRGPYRFVLVIFLAVLIVSLVLAMFIILSRVAMERTRRGQGTQAGQAPASNVVQTQPNFIVVTLQPPDRTKLPSRCDDQVNITNPTAGDEINFELFDIKGTATHDQFESFTVEIDANSSNQATAAIPFRWVLMPEVRVPVRDGLLVEKTSIRNMVEGDYVLRLKVTLRENLPPPPPCEVVIHRKP